MNAARFTSPTLTMSPFFNTWANNQFATPFMAQNPYFPTWGNGGWNPNMNGNWNNWNNNWNWGAGNTTGTTWNPYVSPGFSSSTWTTTGL
jgi:hypothetical protein